MGRWGLLGRCETHLLLPLLLRRSLLRERLLDLRLLLRPLERDLDLRLRSRSRLLDRLLRSLWLFLTSLSRLLRLRFSSSLSLPTAPLRPSFPRLRSSSDILSTLPEMYIVQALKIHSASGQQ